MPQEWGLTDGLAGGLFESARLVGRGRRAVEREARDALLAGAEPEARPSAVCEVTLRTIPEPSLSLQRKQLRARVQLLWEVEFSCA